MELSKSKMALAKVINENGGWVDDTANWAVQPKHENGDVWFSTSKSKPYSPSGGLGFTFKGQGSWLGVVAKFDKVLPNWHQCVLSREEYYQAYPKADADGWIEWTLDELPVEKGTIIDVKYSDGDELHGAPCGEFAAGLVSIRGEPARAEQFGLFDDGVASIIAYRLHNPDAKPEFCESLTSSIPDQEEIFSESASIPRINQCRCSVVDVKPTIEQLAQDYRNAKDHADRLQKEADDAAEEADVKFGDLELLMESLGFSVIYVGYKQKNELLITDWRDLKVGDEIRCIGDWQDEETHGLIFKVDMVEESSYKYDLAVRVVLDDGSGAWGKDFEFIRRP